jgi:hypothetical protein
VDGVDAVGQRVEGVAGLLGSLGGRLGQLADLVGDHREAAALLAGTGGLDRGVECQQVGLVGDAEDLGGRRDALWATSRASVVVVTADSVAARALATSET